MAWALSLSVQKGSITTQDAKVLTKPYVGPFPHHSRPSADECRAVKAALEELHGPIVRVSGPGPGQAGQVPSALSARRMLEVEDEERKHVLDRRAIKYEQQESETGNQLKQSSPAQQNGVSYKLCKEEFVDDLHAVHAGTCPVLRGEGAEAIKREPLTDVQRSKVSPLLPEGVMLEAKIEKSPGERRDFLRKVALEDLKLDRDQKCGSNALLSDVPATPSERAADLKWVKQESVEHDTGAEEYNLRLPNLLEAYETPQRVLRSQTKKSRADHRKSEAETLEEPSANTDERRQLESGTMPLQPKKRKFEDSAAAGALVTFPTTPEPLEAGNQTSKSPLTPAPQDAAAASHMSVLDSLVRTILSQNTTDNNSKRAFASLKEMLPTWEDVRAAGQGPLAASIKCGGLAEIKARRILDILDSLAARRGALELEHLRFMSDEEVKAELSQFKGVGPKTVACVLMFCLDRHEFPVDTHVWRISKRLGWVPQSADREATYMHLNQRVPDDVKYDLHCLLVGHGKKCPGCAKGGRPQKAPDGPCPLTPWIRAACK